MQNRFLTVSRVSFGEDDDYDFVPRKDFTMSEKLEKAIQESTLKYGVNATYALKSCMYLYYKGEMPFYPEVLHFLKCNEVKEYVLKNYSEYVFSSLSDLLLVSRIRYHLNDKTDTILDVVYPYVRNTYHVDRPQLPTWNVVGNLGIGPNTKQVNGMIDYVIEKHDGLYFESYILKGELGSYCIGTTENKWFSLNYNVSMSGEIVDDKFFVQVGYELRNIPTHVNIGDVTFKVIKPYRNVPARILSSLPKEGVIVCVSGVEYKLKFENTVDVMFTGTKLQTGGNHPVVLPCADKGDTTMGIVECVYVNNYVGYKIVKQRKDKTIAQTMNEVEIINNSVKVKEFVTQFSGVPDQHLSNTVDILCTSEVKKLIVEAAEANDEYINKERVQAYCNSKKRFVTDNQIKTGMMSLGFSGVGIKRLDVSKFNEALKYVPDFASRHDIWKFAVQSRVRLLPLDFCISCANAINKRVSISKVMGLVGTGDLIYVHNMISGKIYGGKISDCKLSKANVVPFVRLGVKDFAEEVVSYFERNYGKFIHEDLLNDFLTGSFSSDDMFVFNLVKFIMHEVGGAKSFKDPTTWRRVLELPGVRQKMSELYDRYDEHGCIGDVKTVHVCENGKVWKPEDYKLCNEDVIEKIVLESARINLTMNELVAIVQYDVKVTDADVRRIIFKLEKKGKLKKDEVNHEIVWMSVDCEDDAG